MNVAHVMLPKLALRDVCLSRFTHLFDLNISIRIYKEMEISDMSVKSPREVHASGSSTRP